MGEAVNIPIWRRWLSAALGVTHDGQRNLYQVFGYPEVLTPELLYSMYRRSGYAGRIIRAFPQATWRDAPCIRDEAGDGTEEGKDGYSPFAAAVEQFCEERNIFRALERLDRVASVGRYGVLVLGFRDGKRLNEPFDGGQYPLLYVQPYGEPNVKVLQWDQDETSPRFGKPLAYQIETGNPMGGDRIAPRRSFQVHWSRVIHVTEFPDEDGSYGMPRLECVFNALLDLLKVQGGGAEVFWLCANRGLLLSNDKDARLDDADIKDQKQQMEEFSNQLRRYLVGTGVSATVLGSDAPDPEPHIAGLIDEVSAGAGIPKRIMLGTEEARLAGTQDANSWDSRIDERRQHFATPSILRPFVQILIDTGNLPAPQGQWWVEWPDVAALGPVEESTVLTNRTAALTNYGNSPQAQLVVPVQEFRRDFLGLEPDSDFDFDQPAEIDETDPDLQDDPEPEPQPIANARARTAYVHRRVLNARAILSWARAQGFRNLVPESELHVTVAHSKVAFDWMRVGGPWTPADADDTGGIMIPPGGVRLVEALGNDGAVVLMFTSADLSARHDSIRYAGAEWVHDQYQPHITLSYDDRGLNLDLVEPYTGAIALGPEVWREIEMQPNAAAA